MISNLFFVSANLWIIRHSEDLTLKSVPWDFRSIVIFFRQIFFFVLWIAFLV